MPYTQFVKIPADQSIGPKYEVIINRHFINFAVASKPGQLGKSIVTLARGPEGQNTVASSHDLETLARMISSLTPVQVYDTARGEVSNAGLVNMDRVIEITEHDKFVHLAFVDGEKINITNRLV